MVILINYDCYSLLDSMTNAGLMGKINFYRYISTSQRHHQDTQLIYIVSSVVSINHQDTQLVSSVVSINTYNTTYYIN